VSEDHLPINMMVKTGMFARHMAIAAAERLEWVTTSLASKPSMSLPMACTAALIIFSIYFKVICHQILLLANILMDQSLEKLWIDWTFRKVKAQWMTGSRSALVVQCMVMILSFSLFFWLRNLTETVLARWSRGFL